MSQASKSDKILIVGGGTWGCSTALELARRGYVNVTVLDSDEIPSPIAAGNDINKIMEEGEPTDGDSDEQYVWGKLHEMCTERWLNDPVYQPYYHRTGYVMAACSDEAYKAVLEDVVGHEDEFVKLDSPGHFRITMPEGVLQGDFPGWRGFWKKSGAGWVFAKGAIIAAYNEATRLGVTFLTGRLAGAVTGLLCADTDTKVVLGARTADGVEHMADFTILASGANANCLLDFKDQLRPTAWTLAHIPIHEGETDMYKDLPVLFNIEKGFFMEPDAERHELKVCDEHPGYCNFEAVNGAIQSVPFARHQIPVEAEKRMRAFLQECVPQLAERPFTFARICWDADTPDRMFLIGQHPDRPRLLLAVGGSGHSFKAMPIIGKIVVDLLEGNMDSRMKRLMRWRPETAIGRDWWDTQGRFGADGKVMNFKSVKRWTCIGET